MVVLFDWYRTSGFYSQNRQQLLEGRDPNRLVVKLHEESHLLATDAELLLSVQPPMKVEPLFVQEMAWLEKRYRRLQSKNAELEDLRTYVVFTGEDQHWIPSHYNGE